MKRKRVLYLPDVMRNAHQGDGDMMRLDGSNHAEEQMKTYQGNCHTLPLAWLLGCWQWCGVHVPVTLEGTTRTLKFFFVCAERSNAANPNH